MLYLLSGGVLEIEARASDTLSPCSLTKEHTALILTLKMETFIAGGLWEMLSRPSGACGNVECRGHSWHHASTLLSLAAFSVASSL